MDAGQNRVQHEQEIDVTEAARSLFARCCMTRPALPGPGGLRTVARDDRTAESSRCGPLYTSADPTGCEYCSRLSIRIRQENFDRLQHRLLPAVPRFAFEVEIFNHATTAWKKS